jgi:hypothetical protein
MKERQKLATFLKDQGLADGIDHPQMRSPYAVPVRTLRAHHANGCAAAAQAARARLPACPESHAAS